MMATIVWSDGEYSDHRTVFTDCPTDEHMRAARAALGSKVEAVCTGEQWIEGGPQPWNDLLTDYDMRCFHDDPCALRERIQYTSEVTAPYGTKEWLAQVTARNDDHARRTQEAAERCQCWRTWAADDALRGLADG